MQRIIPDYSTCGEGITGSNCVIYVGDSITTCCTCEPTTLTEILDCFNGQLDLTGLNTRCLPEPTLNSCGKLSIKNTLQSLIDKICEPLDCEVVRGCVDCEYIQNCVEFPPVEPRITCNEIQNTCINCAYIDSLIQRPGCLNLPTVGCEQIIPCITREIVEDLLGSSFTFATYIDSADQFVLNCPVIKECINCSYIQSCIPPFDCVAAKDCIDCAYINSCVDLPDLKLTSPYIYFQTTEDEFSDVVITDFEAIEQIDASLLCSAVTYDLLNLKTNVVDSTGTLANIETFLNTNYKTVLTSGNVTTQPLAAKGIYHYRVVGKCGTKTFIGNEIQFEISDYSENTISQGIRNSLEFNDSTVGLAWDAADKHASQNNHYYTLYYVDYGNGSTMMTPNGNSVNIDGFRSTFNNAVSPISPVVNSTDVNRNPYLWMYSFKNWLNSYFLFDDFRYVPVGAITVINSGTTPITNSFRIRIKSPVATPIQLSNAANYGSEISSSGYTQLNGFFGTVGQPEYSSHNFKFTTIKYTKPI